MAARAGAQPRHRSAGEPSGCGSSWRTMVGDGSGQRTPGITPGQWDGGRAGGAGGVWGGDWARVKRSVTDDADGKPKTGARPCRDAL